MVRGASNQFAVRKFSPSPGLRSNAMGTTRADSPIFTLTDDDDELVQAQPGDSPTTAALKESFSANDVANPEYIASVDSGLGLAGNESLVTEESPNTFDESGGSLNAITELPYPLPPPPNAGAEVSPDDEIVSPGSSLAIYDDNSQANNPVVGGPLEDSPLPPPPNAGAEVSSDGEIVLPEMYDDNSQANNPMGDVPAAMEEDEGLVTQQEDAGVDPSQTPEEIAEEIAAEKRYRRESRRMKANLDQAAANRADQRRLRGIEGEQLVSAIEGGTPQRDPNMPDILADGGAAAAEYSANRRRNNQFAQSKPGMAAMFGPGGGIELPPEVGPNEDVFLNPDWAPGGIGGEPNKYITTGLQRRRSNLEANRRDQDALQTLVDADAAATGGPKRSYLDMSVEERIPYMRQLAKQKSQNSGRGDRYYHVSESGDVVKADNKYDRAPEGSRRVIVGRGFTGDNVEDYARDKALRGQFSDRRGSDAQIAKKKQWQDDRIQRRESRLDQRDQRREEQRQDQILSQVTPDNLGDYLNYDAFTRTAAQETPSGMAAQGTPSGMAAQETGGLYPTDQTAQSTPSVRRITADKVMENVGAGGYTTDQVRESIPQVVAAMPDRVKSSLNQVASGADLTDPDLRTVDIWHPTLTDDGNAEHFQEVKGRLNTMDASEKNSALVALFDRTALAEAAQATTGMIDMIGGDSDRERASKYAGGIPGTMGVFGSDFLGDRLNEDRESMLSGKRHTRAEKIEMMNRWVDTLSQPSHYGSMPWFGGAPRSSRTEELKQQAAPSGSWFGGAW